MLQALDDVALAALKTWIGGENEGIENTGTERVSKIIADYDVCATVETILAEHISDTFRVALQFPDHLLPDAPLVCEALRAYTERALSIDAEVSSKKVFYFLLGDTSYGECCVDEVAAQHLATDLIVHYGNACLSPTQSLPVLYVFPRFHFDDVELATKNFQRAVQAAGSSEGVDRIVLLYDVELRSCFGLNWLSLNSLRTEYRVSDMQKDVRPARMRLKDQHCIVRPGTDCRAISESQVPVGSLSFERGDVALSRTAFVWFTKSKSLDDWPPAIRNAALQLCTGPDEICAGFYATSLTTEMEDSVALVDGSRILRKRFAVLSKAKDAERIGIVPGTLGVSGNLDVIDRCKRIVKSAGKRSYVLLVGKPNPSKLANFAEIDVFVLVACPENALLDGRDYLRPIITPLELEAALLADGDVFSSPYSVDFRDLLDRELILENEDENAGNDPKEVGTVATRGDWSVQVAGEGGAAEFLKSRQWQGLKYGVGGEDDETDITDLPTEVEVGQAGIASRYDREL